MSRTLTVIIVISLFILAITVFAGLVWANTLYVQEHPHEKGFLVPWLAARTFLQYGDNPYDDPATQRAQIVYYGTLANENEDPLRLNVPFPIEIFYLPFALITDYALARGLWMTFLEIALVALGFLSFRLIEWKPARFLEIIVLVFSVLWLYGFLPLEAGQSIIFIALAVTGLLLALRDQREELVGALLVFPFFKPDVTGIFVIFVLWWAIYHRRWRVVAGFLMALTLLVGISFFLLPGWFLPFLRGVITHINFNPGLSPGSIMGSWWPFVGPRLGWGLTIVLLLVLFVEWRDVRKKDFRHVLWTACMTLALTPLIGIPLMLEDEVVLFLPLFLFLAILNERWSPTGMWGPAGITVLALFAGPWLLDLVLTTSGSSFLVHEILFLFLPLLVVTMLYWMRWWAVRPPRTWVDTIP